MPLVLTHKADTGYDDVPEERYHFPETYRRLVERSAGEWFVYYEPRRGNGRKAYVAMARLGHMWADPALPGHFYVAISDYRQFTNPVPWQVAGLSFERGLQKADGSPNKGQFGRAVRELAMSEFETILAHGFARALEDDSLPVPMAAEPMAVTPRLIVEMVVQKKVRDRAFMVNVRDAYEKTCAFTGLRVENGGGWTEMEAAHIRPVESDGPDSVRNGLALSRTMHALFDRGFLSLTDDLRILEAKAHPLPDQLRSMLLPNGVARVPEEGVLRPHPTFLRFHRENIFKGRAA